MSEEKDDRYVVALEISSSKIIGAVGKPSPDGTLDVIALEQEKCIECVRRGFIQNIEETSLRIRRIIEKLQRKPAVAPRKITSIFLGLSGRSMKALQTQAMLNLPEENIITEESVKKLRRQALQTPVDSMLEIIDAVPRTYQVNKNNTQTPIGTFGDSISATFDLIVARPELKRNISRTVEEKCKLKVDGYVVTALATGHLILSDDQKRLGCMLADIGAETTTVTIYKHGHLQYYATVPIGSRNITKDIISLNVLEEKAEEIKLSAANAIAPETPNTLNIHGVKLSDVSSLVVARAEEIVANIIAQIEYAGLKNSDLPAGIVVIGGGAKLNGMVELIKKQSMLDVTRGEFPSYVHIEDSRIPTSEIIEVVSVLYAAGSMTDTSCTKLPDRELPKIGETPEPDPEPTPAPAPTGGGGTGSSFFRRLKEKLIKGITPGDDDDDSELE